MPALSLRLVGKVIKNVRWNGNLLCIETDDGSEVMIAWVNEDTGELVKGRPMIAQHGVRLRAGAMRDIISPRDADAVLIVPPPRRPK